MEVECVKYKEKMDSGKAVCRHPGDYCQHRSACIINYLEQENKREQEQAAPEVDVALQKTPQE